MIYKTRNLCRKIGFKKLFWCFFTIAVILVSIVSIFPNNDAVPINNESTQSFNEGWKLANTGDTINLPYVLETVANETVTISKVLPDVFEQSNPTLSFHSSLQTILLEVEGRVIYTYAQNPDVYFDVQPPPAWHVVRLAPDMAGKVISITYSSPYNRYAGVLNDIEIGTKYANVSALVGSRLLSIAVCFVIFSFGLFAIIVCVFAHNKVANLNQLLYLGIASLLISLWSFCETKAAQILIGNVQAIMFITFLSIMLFPIALLLFFRGSFSGKAQTLYNILIGTFSLYFIVVVLLQMVNVATFNDYFIILFILIGIMLVLILSTHVFAYLKNKTTQNRLPMIAVSILLVFAMVDMYRYLFKNLALTSYSDTSVFVRIGILGMLFILGYSSIRQLLVYYATSSKADVYKVLSQTDSLSGLKNRAFLSEVCTQDFQNAIKHKKSFSVIMLDIDNFKSYNDHYGHSAGDEVIRSVAEVLQAETENAKASAIRYGGEEFLVVLTDSGLDKAIAAAKKIKAGIEMKNIPHAYNSAAPMVSISQGIFSAVPKQGDSLEHFIDCSDQAMYSVKKGNKNGYAVYQLK